MQEVEKRRKQIKRARAIVEEPLAPAKRELVQNHPRKALVRDYFIRSPFHAPVERVERSHIVADITGPSVRRLELNAARELPVEAVLLDFLVGETGSCRRENRDCETSSRMVNLMEYHCEVSVVIRHCKFTGF